MRKDSFVVGLACLSLLTPACGGTIAWTVPAVQDGNPRPNSATDSLRPEDPPEAACVRIANGATGHKTFDTVLGATLGVVGVGGAASSAALVTKSAHQPEYYGEWALIGAVGLTLAAAGIYFLTRGGNDRAEFWAANAAVAQTRADYTLNGPDSGKSKTEELRAAVDSATALRDDAQNQLADATAELTAKQTVLKTVQDAATKRLTDSGQSGPDSKGAGAPKPKVDPAAEQLAIIEVSVAADAVGAAQKKVNLQTQYLAAQSNVLSRRQSALAARQAAWLHCASALQVIGGVDASANTAFANAIATGTGSKSSSGSDTSGASKGSSGGSTSSDGKSGSDGK